MRWAILITVGLMVSACSDSQPDSRANGIAEAETSYRQARHHGTLEEQCQAARSVQREYSLLSHDEAYRAAGVDADLECIEYANAKHGSVDHGSSPPVSTPSQRPAPVEIAAEPLERCWQGYCPCEEDGDIDRMLCRNMRGGVDVSDDMMASGAAMRDGRKALDDWDAGN